MTKHTNKRARDACLVSGHGRLAGAARRGRGTRWGACAPGSEGPASWTLRESLHSRSSTYICYCAPLTCFIMMSHFNNSFLTPCVLSSLPGMLRKCPDCSCLFLTHSQQNGPYYANRRVKKSNVVRSQADKWGKQEETEEWWEVAGHVPHLKKVKFQNCKSSDQLPFRLQLLTRSTWPLTTPQIIKISLVSCPSKGN